MTQLTTCAHCGAQMTPPAKFCDKCGNPVSVDSVSAPAPAPVAQPAPHKSSPVPLLIGLGLSLCVVCSLLGLGAFAFLALMDQPTPTPVIALQPTPVPTAPPASPTPLPKPSIAPANVVVNGVMARDAKGDNYEPVGITDTFDGNQAVFHAIVTIANAPKDTVLKIVWTAVDVGSGAVLNTQMGEYEVKAEGSRNVDFTFKPEAGKLPPGKYKAEIFVNSKLDRTLNFAITGAQAQNPTPASKPTTAPVPKPSGLIKNVVLAEDAKGDTKEPVNPTTTFKPAAIFHAVAQTQNAPANTKFTATWIAIDVGTAAAPNTVIDTTETTTSGTRNIDFSLKPTTQWPLGSYRVEVYVNGTLDTVKTFSVK